MKMAIENTVGKGEIARNEQFVMSNFSFADSVFKRLVMQNT